MLSKKSDKDTSKKVFRLLNDSALLLAIFTAFFYCIGTAHLYGMLNALNTDPYLIDRSFHQIVYYGALVLLNAIGPYVIYVFPLLVSMYVALFVGLLEITWTFSRKRKLVNLRKKTRHLIMPQSNSLKFSILFCQIFFLVFGCLYLFQDAGGTKAEKFVSAIESKQTEGLPKFNVKVGSTTLELFRVACGTTHCLGLDQTKMEVLFFEKSAVSYSKIVSK